MHLFNAIRYPHAGGCSYTLHALMQMSSTLDIVPFYPCLTAAVKQENIWIDLNSIACINFKNLDFLLIQGLNISKDFPKIR